MSTQKILTLPLDGMPDEQDYASFKEVLSDAGIRMQIKEHTASDGKKMQFLVCTWDEEEISAKRSRNAGRPRKSHEHTWAEYDALKAEGKTDDEICELLGIAPATLYRRKKERRFFLDLDQEEDSKQFPI